MMTSTRIHRARPIHASALVMAFALVGASLTGCSAGSGGGAATSTSVGASASGGVGAGAGAGGGSSASSGASASSPGGTASGGSTSGGSAPGGTTSVASTSYLAVAARGSTRRVQLVSRTTGKVAKTLATATVPSSGTEPFQDADLGPDGTTWLVATTGTSFYATALRHITSTRTTTVLPYVTSVRVSPDGTRLGVTVLSPDGDGDGRGLSALRIVDVASGKVKLTLSSMEFPVGKDGLPTVEIGGLNVQGWLDNSTLIVGDGCCDSAQVAIVSATTPTREQAWKTFGGDHNTMAIGLLGSDVLATRVRSAKNGMMLGMEAYRINARNMKGTYVTWVKGSDAEARMVADTLVSRAKAKPIYITPKRFPYKGPGTVKFAFL